MSPCPNESVLRALAEGHERSGDNHLLACAACRARVETLREDALAARIRRLAAPGLWSRADPARPASAEPDAPPDASRLPSVEGFRIIRQIGSGGMGSVYEAEQASPRRRVALKMLRPERPASPLRLQFLQREADALARLSHPGIAVVFATGEARSGEPFLVMELVRGEQLDVHVARNVSSPDEILRLIAMVCRAVDHAHRHGVVHRDLKPSNIMVDHAGSPKVLDFGLARVPQETRRSPATLDGRFAGTLAYMSPEQLSGRCGVVDSRTDIYALGVIAYQLLAGALPFEVDDRPVGDIVEAIRSDPPQSLRSRRPDLSDDLDRLVLRSLQKRPQDRYQSAREFAERLEMFRAGIAPTIITTPPVSRRRRFHRFALGGVLAIALGIGLTSFTTLPPPPSPSPAPRPLIHRLGPAVKLEGDLIELERTLRAQVEARGDVRFGWRGPIVTFALVLEQLGKYEEAEGYFSDILSFERAPSHRQAVHLARVARCAGARGAHERAERLFAESLQLASSLDGAHSSARAEVYVSAARYRLRLGQLEQAREFMDRAHACCDNPSNHPQWTEWYVSMGWVDFHLALNQPDAAQLWRTRADRVWALGDDPLRTGPGQPGAPRPTPRGPRLGPDARGLEPDARREEKPTTGA